MYLNQKRFDESLAMGEKLVAHDPDNLPTLNLLGYLHILRGDLEKAKQYFTYARTLSSPHGNLAALGYLAWKTGKHAAARNMFDTLLASRMRELDDGNELYQTRYDIAVLHAVQGNTHEALEWFRRSIDSGLCDDRFMSFNPLLENLRGEDAFQRMIAGMKVRADSMRANVYRSSSESE
jgi:tetratricopeptide (TPR) repeat protein